MAKLDTRALLSVPARGDVVGIQDISDTTDGATGTSKKSVIESVLAGPRIFVAANDATADEKRHANYVCNGVADDVDIQLAINAAEADDSGVVQLSKGTFVITAQLTMDHVQLVGASPYGMLQIGAQSPGTEIEAHSSFPAATSMIEVEGHGCGIIGVQIDGGNYADIGINAVDVWYLTVQHCWFKSFDGSTSQAIRCGGVLGLYLEKCDFEGSVDGYALDAQSTYGSAYYGVNVGHAIGCWFSGRGGHIRLDGIMHFYDCDFESNTYDANPIIEIGPNAQSQVGFFGCYWEINYQSFDVVMIKLSSSAKVTLHGCQLDGDGSANSLGVSAEQAYEHLSVTGCRFNNIATGIKIASSANAGSTFISGNSFNSVTVEVDFTASVGYTTTHHGLVQIPGGLNLFYSGGMRFGSREWTTFTSFDASSAFVHYLTPSGAETLSPGLADYGGQVMVLYFVNANTTLNDAANEFYLQANADITPTAGVLMLFVADWNMRWREVGDYSLRLLNDYTITNDTTDRTFDANSTTLDEIADVLATLIEDLGMT